MVWWRANSFGHIYGIPYNSDTVFIIDPAKKTADTTSLAGLPAGTARWFGGVLSTSGLVFGIPYNSESVLRIDCGAACGETIPSWQQWMLSAYVNKF